MSELRAKQATAQAKVPWHLWFFGAISLLWNAAGAWAVLSAQSGQLSGIAPAEAAYYVAQASWSVAVTDIALMAAILAAAALLLRSRLAVPLYWMTVASLVTLAAYDLAKGTAPILFDQRAVIGACVIWGLAVAQLLYGIRMRRRGVLR